MHMAQLIPLPLTDCCFSKIQIGFAFLVPAHPGSPGKEPLNGCVCVCVCVCVLSGGSRVGQDAGGRAAAPRLASCPVRHVYDPFASTCRAVACPPGTAFDDDGQCRQERASVVLHEPPLSLLQAGCRSCRPTDSVKALKETSSTTQREHKT